MGRLSAAVRLMVGAFILGALWSQVALAAPPEEEVPAGFFLVASERGVAFYQRASARGVSDFVQVIHLDQGATIQPLHGPIVDAGSDEGVYGGDNPLIFTQTLRDVWDDFAPATPGAFCLTNGQFYSSHASAVRLSFPLKIDGRIVSDGFGSHQFPNQQLMLEIWPDRANIRPLSAAALQASDAPHILAGLSEEATGRRPNMITGRTFVGVGQPRQDGTYRAIFIFTSRLARKTEATAALRQFGAEKVMMLDGGASTQLICQGESYIGPGRRIPQTIAVLSAPPLAWGQHFFQPEMIFSCDRHALPAGRSLQPDWPIHFWC